MFPIISEFNRELWDSGGPSKYLPQIFIPWAMIETHDQQCNLNHGGQNLESIAQRGGLSRCEAVAVLEDRPWTHIAVSDADRELAGLVANWLAR